VAIRLSATAIYALLVVALIVQPHVLRQHVWVISPEAAQSLVSALILLLAALTYAGFHRDVRHLRRRYTNRLAASFQYIGVANRQLPLLEQVTSDLLRQPLRTRAEQQDAFHSLLATATVSYARTSWGVFRVVERASGRTAAEYMHGPVEPGTIPGNRSLLALDHAPNGPTVVASNGSDTSFAVFLVLPRTTIRTRAQTTLRAIVDQAALLYGYLRAEEAQFPNKAGAQNPGLLGAVHDQPSASLGHRPMTSSAEDVTREGEPPYDVGHELHHLFVPGKDGRVDVVRPEGEGMRDVTRREA
jgi:hypothetical protein